MTYTPDRTKAVEHQLLDAIEYQIAHPITVDGGDIEIGAVELKDAATDTRGKVVVGSSAAAGDVAVVVADAVLSAQVGATTTAPVADNTTVEDGTARTGISLWKRIANCLIAILGKLPAVGTAGTASANVLSVQGIASGTALGVAVASITLTESAPVSESAVVAAGPTAAPIAAANGTFATGAVVTAKAGNTHTLYIGTATTQSKPLVAGESFSIVCGAGRKTDLNDWYIFGTAGEGVDTLYTGV